MNVNHICLKCMKEKPSVDMSCPHCGFDERENSQNYDYLDYWSVLRGQYLVGKSIGQGGFGITYVGFDMNLEMKVAIKEYFPYGFATRNHNVSDKITIMESEYKSVFEQEKSAFIEEARILAMCNELPGIVKVRDYFQENNTCYIVMEYLEGVTLKDYMQAQGGMLEPETVFGMMEPVIRSMIQIHEHGVIHKDISPDNIMLTNKNRVKLIDFGAAQRRANKGRTAINTYKERFSPLEQRREDGEIGTYSDIYAFCATMYYLMTGKAPDDVMDRNQNDLLMKPSEMGIKISPVQEAALMKGLELLPEDRICDAKDLYFFLYMYGQNNENADQMKQGIINKKTEELTKKLKQAESKKKQQKCMIAIGALICVAIFGHFVLQNLEETKTQKENLSSYYAGMSDEERSCLEEELVLEAISLHSNYGYLTEDNTLTQMADKVAEILEGTSIGTDSWNSIYQSAVNDVYEEYGELFYWMIIPVGQKTDAKEVLDIGLSNTGNKKLFEQSSKIGISATYSEEGYLFYIILMR